MTCLPRPSRTAKQQPASFGVRLPWLGPDPIHVPARTQTQRTGWHPDRTRALLRLLRVSVHEGRGNWTVMESEEQTPRSACSRLERGRRLAGSPVPTLASIARRDHKMGSARLLPAEQSSGRPREGVRSHGLRDSPVRLADGTPLLQCPLPAPQRALLLGGAPGRMSGERWMGDTHLPWQPGPQQETIRARVKTGRGL